MAKQTCGKKLRHSLKRKMVEVAERIHGLDLLRAVSMLLGILLHATLPYILAAETTPPPTWVFLIFVAIHTWRMPLFFILAGFFAAMSLSRNAILSFCWDRFYRIMLPLLLFLPLFQMPYFVKGLRGDWSDASLLHLWFLFYLSLFYIIVVVLGRFVPNRVTEIFDYCFRSSACLCVTIPFLTIASFLGRDLAIFGRPPENVTEFNLGYFIYCFCFFLLGYRLYPHRKLIHSFSDLCFVFFSLLGAALLMIIVFTYLSIFDFQINNSMISWILNLLSVSATLLTCVGFIGLSHRLLKTQSPLIDFAIEVSYPIFYFHLVIMLPVLYYFYDNGWSPQITVSISSFTGLFGSLAIYFTLIRYTPLNWMFNGYKNSRFRVEKLPFGLMPKMRNLK